MSKKSAFTAVVSAVVVVAAAPYLRRAIDSAFLKFSNTVVRDERVR